MNNDLTPDAPVASDTAVEVYRRQEIRRRALVEQVAGMISPGSFLPGHENNNSVAAVAIRNVSLTKAQSIVMYLEGKL